MRIRAIIAVLSGVFALVCSTASGQPLVFTVIDVPFQWWYVQPYGINDAGQLVGVVQDLDDRECDGPPCYAAAMSHGFVASGASIVAVITAPGANFIEGGLDAYTNAYGINTMGEIVGIFGSSRLGSHAFRL